MTGKYSLVYTDLPGLTATLSAMAQLPIITQP